MHKRHVMLTPHIELRVLATILEDQVGGLLAHPGQVDVVEGVDEDHQGAAGYWSALGAAYVVVRFF